MLGLADECNVFIYSTAFRSAHFVMFQTESIALPALGLNTSSPLTTPQSAHAS